MNASRGKRSLGAVYTPDAVIEFMFSLLPSSFSKPLSVLEPACADAPFLQAFHHRYGGKHSLCGVEVDVSSASQAARSAESSASQAARSAEDTEKKITLSSASFIQTDYLLWQPSERFDLIIGNPPYGIIGDASHYPISALQHVKAQYKAKFQTWHGKYNIYGAFIEHSVRLLKPHGELLFVIPSTWLVLDDFKLLRRFLSERGELNIHYLGKAFQGVSVIGVVLHFKLDSKAGAPHRLRLYDGHQLQFKNPAYTGGLIRFETPETAAFETASATTVGELVDIHFAARSPEVNRSEFVYREKRRGTVALLTGRNLKAGVINYEKNYTGLWVEHRRASELRKFYGSSHLVVGHTKGAQVVAALDEKCYPWREEFHLVPKCKLDLPLFEAYLNSADVQQYVSTLYRDLTPHLTRTQLSRLPVPKQFLSTTTR